MVSGRSILPGAAMFEAAFAAAAALLPEELQAQAGLNGAAIAAPLMLKAPGTGSPVLHAAVQRSDGAVQLASSTATVGKRARPVVHLTATASTVAPPVAAAELVKQPAVQIQHAVLLQQGQLGPAAPVWAGQAIGSVSQAPLQPVAHAFHCHPAAVDAATHFGAVFDLSAAAAPRVPVALGCYTAGSVGGRSASERLFASASRGRLLPDVSRVSTFCLSGGHAGLLRLSGLQSRPIGTQGFAAAGDRAALKATADRLATECCAYEMVWQVAAPLGPSTGHGGRQVPSLLRLRTAAAAATVQAPSGSLQQAALRSYAATLRMLHALQPGTEQQLAAVSAGAAQHGAPLAAPIVSRQPLAAAGAAAVAGLFKVAALEEPAWQLQHFVADRYAAAGGLTGTGLRADAQGAAAAAAADFMPRMLLAVSQPPSSGVDGLHQQHTPGCHVISGGMGGLGELTACHLAHAAPHGSHLLLLGRTGRFAGAVTTAAQLELLQSTGTVTLLQADAAAAADGAAVSAQLAAYSAPAASFIHTAGMLADGLLPQQRLGGARRVLAPKLAGLEEALHALLRQPLQRLLLFSSVSAALGNRGQANYAAANAVLDAASCTLAASGCSSASVQWGAWAGAGMAAQTPQLLTRLQKQGQWAGRWGCLGRAAASACTNLTA